MSDDKNKARVLVVMGPAPTAEEWTMPEPQAIVTGDHALVVCCGGGVVSINVGGTEDGVKVFGMWANLTSYLVKNYQVPPVVAQALTKALQDAMAAAEKSRMPVPHGPLN